MRTKKSFPNTVEREPRRQQTRQKSHGGIAKDGIKGQKKVCQPRSSEKKNLSPGKKTSLDITNVKKKPDQG